MPKGEEGVKETEGVTRKKKAPINGTMDKLGAIMGGERAGKTE